MSKRRGSRELEPRPIVPLASPNLVDQIDGCKERKEEKEEEMMISPRSDSPRGRYLIYRMITVLFVK